MSTYFELRADFLSLKSDGRLLADFKVPAAKHFFRQIPVGLEDLKIFPKGLGHAARERYDHQNTQLKGWK